LAGGRSDAARLGRGAGPPAGPGGRESLARSPRAGRPAGRGHRFRERRRAGAALCHRAGGGGAAALRRGGEEQGGGGAAAGPAAGHHPGRRPGPSGRGRRLRRGRRPGGHRRRHPGPARRRRPVARALRGGGRLCPRTLLARGHVGAAARRARAEAGGRAMTIRARAPLRLGLAGGGTDVAPYCDLHGGYVMNAAIDRHAYAIVEEGGGDAVEFATLDHGAHARFRRGEVDTADARLQLLTGAYLRVCRDFLGGEQPPLRLRSWSDAPPGSGLGSSSTMVVALVTALAEHFALPLGEYELAHLAYEIERHDLALAGGKQDQYAAAFGGFNFMEFHRDDRVIVNPLRMKDWVLAELEA